MARKNFIFKYGIDIAPNSNGIGTVFTVNNRTGNIGIGTTNPTTKMHVVGTIIADNFTGNSSYALQAGIATNVSGGTASVTSLNVTGLSTLGIVTAGNIFSTGIITATSFSGNSSSATQLQNSRNFSISGDFITAPSISFNGTGNVALAATITPDSIILGTYTSGDYVKNISGTANQITVTGGTGESSIPTISLPPQLNVPQDLVVLRDLQVNRNLNVNGNITIGGTSAKLFTTEFKVGEPDIILGFRTDSNGNDISTDNTANHGGIAIASTEGSPLVSLYNVAIGETNPATYKKIMWFKSGSFTGLNTDAWLINYAVGIGSTQFPTGTRLAAGSVQFTERDLATVRNINATGIITATTFSGSGASLNSIPNSALNNSTISGISLGSNLNTLTLNTSTYLSGSATYNGSSATTFTVSTNATSSNTASTIVARDASGNFSAGIITATTFSGNLQNTLTLNTSGTGLSGSATYNNSGASTFTVTSNATSLNTGSTIVARDASGNFSAGTITATFSGNVSGGTVSGTTGTFSSTVSTNGGRLYFRDNSIEEFSTNANAEIGVNYSGYNSGTTQFRDLTIYNGKQSQIAKFTGSTGNFTTSGSITSSSTVQGTTFTSTVATGTAPLTVSSTTQVTNLNANFLNGLSSATSNTGSTIVARDASGNFSAGTISANVTGNLTNTVTGTNSTEIVRGNMADNDQFRILIGGTASNSGFVEFATADDGTEPIYFRQYTGVFSSIARTLTLLDANGDSSFPGTLTATVLSSPSGKFTGNLAAWNPTTPGTGVGGVHLGAASGSSNVGPAITFGARDSSSGTTGQAGIYINSDGTYGTRMYFATTDSYATGSKVAMSINESGTINIVRSGLNINSTLNINTGNVTGGDALVVQNGGDLRLYSGSNAGSVNLYCDTNGVLNVGGSIIGSSLRVTTSTAGNFGSIAASWGGSTNYPTLYGDDANRWIMHINPHISYTQNGLNGYTGSMTGATIRMASDTSATTYWDMGIGTNSVGTDKFSIGRAGTSLLTVSNNGTLNVANRKETSSNIANFGQLETHGTYTDANSVQQWGGTFIQNSTNTPNFNGSTQHYQMMLSLGSNYDWGSGNVYAAQIAFGRNVTNPYIGIRYKEGGNNTANWGSWQKISAGFADSASSLALTNAVINSSAWAGNSGWHGYTYNGGNFRFGFSSTAGVVDVYADGNFYATDSSHLVWHQGNDGSGSGLDADLLDGLNASSANTGSTIVARDASGNFSAGTITANLTNTVTGTNSTEIVRGNMADNDQFRILIGGTASNSGFVEFATADDGTEPIYFRQYTGVFSSIARTLTLLDASGNTSFPGSITAGGNVTAYSDIKLKDNITIIDNALEKVLQLNGVTFTRKDHEDKHKRHAGVIAQEVEKVLPEVVSEDNQGIKNVAYGNMVGLLIEAIKEQQRDINNLKQQIKDLKTL